MAKIFPNDFLCGASTSAFQVEGAYKEDGKGENTADTKSYLRNNIQADTRVTADHYHHWQEDVALMKELGMKSYRFSICWSRIFPNGNDKEPNQLGVAFYDNLINELCKYKIEPIVTLLHFDIPSSLIAQYDGFLSREIIDDFDHYARFLFNHFKGRVRYWLTINEQNIMVMNKEMCGIDDPNPHRLRKKLQQINYHMFLANAKAISSCHEILPNAWIGPALSYPTIYPASSKPIDIATSKTLQERMSYAYMDIYIHGEYSNAYRNYLIGENIYPHTQEGDDEILKHGICDYLGLNWYCSTTIKAGNPQPSDDIVMHIPNLLTSIKNPHVSYTEWGWSYDPLALCHALKECWARYRKPLMITENGWSEVETLTEDGHIHDTKRIQYLHDHIKEMRNAMNDGVHMIGYHTWSFIDVLSSGDGFRKRYGLVYVDRDEFDAKECRRYKKDSFYYYQNVIKHNGEVLTFHE